MSIHVKCLLPCILAAAIGLLTEVSSAQSAIEELPPPAHESAVTPRNRTEETKAVSAGDAATASNAGNAPAWGLAGASGRFYFIDGRVLAEYVRGGIRRVVLIREEDSASFTRVDPNYRYFREEGGDRWAFAVHAGTDVRHSVYYQASGSQTWVLFQRATAIWDRQEMAAQIVYALEPACSQ